MTEKKSRLLSAIREAMNKSGGCCGDGTCGCSPGEKMTDEDELNLTDEESN